MQLRFRRPLKPPKKKKLKQKQEERKKEREAQNIIWFQLEISNNKMEELLG